mgnify:CR=1 FL=1
MGLIQEEYYHPTIGDVSIVVDQHDKSECREKGDILSLHTGFSAVRTVSEIKELGHWLINQGRIINYNFDSKGRKRKKRLFIRYIEGALAYCSCSCGNETVTRSADVFSGNTTSCGCYQKEVVKKLNRTPNTGCSILKPEQIPEIRKMLEEGKTPGQVAIRFGVNYHTIRNIRKGLSFRNF